METLLISSLLKTVIKNFRLSNSEQFHSTGSRAVRNVLMLKSAQIFFKTNARWVTYLRLMKW